MNLSHNEDEIIMELHLTLQAAPHDEALGILLDDMAHLLAVTFERFNLGEPVYEFKIVETAGE